MRVRIKSAKEIKRFYGDYQLIEDRFGSNVPFVKPMFEYCNKIFYIEKRKIVGWTGAVYKSLDKNNSWVWANYMFDIVPEMDKKKNYLLEF